MGTKRVGLARTQKLIENLKRSIDWNGSTLTDVIVTTSRAITGTGNIIASGSAFQSLGAYSYHGESAASYGLYRCAYEVDFSGSTPTATEHGLLKTVATLPANARIMKAGTICSEAMTSGPAGTAWTSSLNLILGMTTTAADADDAITFTAGVLSASAGGLAGNPINQFSSSAGGAAGAMRIASASANTSQFVVHGGSGTKLVFANSGSANVNTGGELKLSAGKLVVWLEYVGSGAPSNLDDA